MALTQEARDERTHELLERAFDALSRQTPATTEALAYAAIAIAEELSALRRLAGDWGSLEEAARALQRVLDDGK